MTNMFMQPLKSELDFAVQLTQDLLTDIADLVGTNTLSLRKLARDKQEIARRSASEGFSFLTKTLPSLGKKLDRALAQADCAMDYTGFVTRGGYPEFLGDLFRRIFDHSGRSLSDADPYVVRYVRQILYLWYKYELPYTQKQKTDLEDRFTLTEASLPDEVPDCPVLQGARDLIARVVEGFSYEAISPRHGPGAVATRERPWEKWAFKRLYQPIERFFPFGEWYVPSVSYLAGIGGRIHGENDMKAPYESPLDYLEVQKHGTARAVFVPKDSRGPRLISCEPLEYQWIQQGVAAELVYCINSSEFTSGRVNFTHQGVNRRYALFGSMGGGWVTLDMKDASDRVTTKLVERLFANTHVSDYLLSCRTQCTVLPSGQKVWMKKYAPMGSALCFPVESLVFFALAANVLVHHCGYPLDIACARLKVYGDDIICHLEDYEAVMQYFPYVGLMFNEQKCCTGGLFRESCGLDAYAGVDVTPVKFRSRNDIRHDRRSLVSWVEYSNVFDYHMYWRAAKSIRDYIRAQCPRVYTSIGLLDHDEEPKGFLAFRMYTAQCEDAILERRSNTTYRDCRNRTLPIGKYGLPTKWSRRYSRQEHLGCVISGVRVYRRLPPWQRLMANIATFEPRLAQPYRNVSTSKPSSGMNSALAEIDDELEVAVGMFPVRRRVTLTRRWCA